MKEKVIFETIQSENSRSSILVKVLLPNFIFILLFGILTFSTFKFDFEENPLLFLIPVIFIIQIVIWKLIKFNYKKVHYLEFSNNNIYARFTRGYSQHNITLPISSTDINLIELKDYRSFFDGIQINVLNKNIGTKLRLLDSDWSYETFEKIYLEFKKRKNENIPENEIKVYEQLQIMNRTRKNVG